MHPVLEHILDRQNKKVPTDDGRKIALVLDGGMMRGVRGGGAMIALEELGLRNAFDEIYSYSAGLPNACYLLSGNVRVGNSIYFEDISSFRFINFLRVHRIMDIEYLVNMFKNGKKNLNWSNLLSSKTKVYTTVFDTHHKILKKLEIHKYNEEDFFQLMAASISIPFLNLDKYRIRDVLYRDAIISRGFYKTHLQFAFDSEATDILVIHNSYKNDNGFFENSNRIFNVFPPSGEKLNRFETRRRVLKEQCFLMGNKIKKTFGNKDEISLD